MRQIYVYYEDGKILGYSARPDSTFGSADVAMIPLDLMRKFYDGVENINTYEIYNDKLQKKDQSIYDESYINDDFFEIDMHRRGADFRIVLFKDCIVIFLDQDRMKYRSKDVLFYLTKKDDPSILFQTVEYDQSKTSITIEFEEPGIRWARNEFSIYATNNTFTYSLEI